MDCWGRDVMVQMCVLRYMTIQVVQESDRSKLVGGSERDVPTLILRQTAEGRCDTIEGFEPPAGSVWKGRRRQRDKLRAKQATQANQASRTLNTKAAGDGGAAVW